MNPAIKIILILLCLAALPAQASEQRLQASEQKMRLLQSILASPRVQQVDREGAPEARAQVARARQLLEAARQALAAGEAEQAASALDQALRAVSQGSGGVANASALRARYTELREQVATYRASLLEARQDAKAAPVAGAALEQVDRLSAEAERQVATGKYAEANRLLGEAYNRAVSALSTLGAGKTITLALKFDTPADEYAYEQKRHQSHAMLVEMMLAEGRAEGRRATIDAFVEAARREQVEADRVAASGQPAVAIPLLERATVHLLRALQAMGVPAF